MLIDEEKIFLEDKSPVSLFMRRPAYPILTLPLFKRVRLIALDGQI